MPEASIVPRRAGSPARIADAADADRCPRITVERASKQFAPARPASAPTAALENVSLHLDAGELVCLLGPSGCGKSTVLNLIAGFERADAGHVLQDGRPIEGPGPERGMVFQQPHLFPWLSVLDNVSFGPRMRGLRAAQFVPQAMSYLERVGLRDFAQHLPWQLSGGMRQRVALARAWVAQPEILLMDEPFAALDAQTRLSMQELLLRIWSDEKTSILFVTHDVDEALFIADRVLIMSARPGRIIEALRVPFARPRSLEDLVADPSFGQLKRAILHRVRVEARQALGLSDPDALPRS